MVNNIRPHPHQWAHWLQKIQEKPGHHSYIIKDKNKFLFLDNQAIVSKKALDSLEILKISKEILKKNIGAIDKHKIISGINYIISKREARFNALGFITKLFALLMGVKYAIEQEKKSIFHLTQTFIQQQIKELNEQKLGEEFNSPEKKKKFNERVFQCARGLFAMKERNFCEDPLSWKKEGMKRLEMQLDDLNPHLPSIATLIEVFGSEEVLKSSLNKTVSLLCSLYQLDQSDLDVDCNFFNCNSVEMKAIYVQRMIKVFKTGFSLSTVTAIEKTWQEMLEKNQTQSEERQINEHHVIFIPESTKKEIYIKENFLAMGGFKAAFLATSYLDLQTEKMRREMVILQPKTAVAQELQAENQNNKLGKRPFASQEMILGTGDPYSFEKEEESFFFQINNLEGSSFIIKSEGGQEEYLDFDAKEDIENAVNNEGEKEISDLFSFFEDTATQDQTNEEDHGEREKQGYRKEAELCLELSHLDGIWPTHKVTEICGEMAIIQKAAGYKITTIDGQEKVAIDLGAFVELSEKKLLNTKDQVVFLRMIGDFLKGVKSLHQKKMIHRDLKPENILCSKEGRCGLSDFGVSCKDTNDEDLNNGISNPKREMTGSNYYIAPEIVKWTSDVEDWKKISTKADIWSCGIILWELLSGRPIYEHPAIRFPSIAAYEFVGELLNKKKPEEQQFYNIHFPEPNDQDGILYLIWKSTRAEPDQRLDIETLSLKFDKWADKTKQKLEKGQIHSIFEALNSNS